MKKPESGGPIRSQGSYQKGKQQNHPYKRPQGRGNNNNNKGQYRPMAQGAGRGSGSKPAKEENPHCYNCGKTGHLSNKYPEERRCYNCHEPGHFASDCRAPKAEPYVNVAKAVRPKAKGRVYYMDGREASRSDLIQGVCVIAGNTLSVLFDSSATHSFISMDFVNRLKLPVSSSF